MGTTPITVSIILVNYNTVRLILQCLESIYTNCCRIPFEVIVVDNASDDGSVDSISKYYPKVILMVNNQNEGFSKANNMAIKMAKGEYILLLNSDTMVLPGAIELLVKFIKCRTDVSAVGPRLLNADKTLQRSWFNFPSSMKTFCNIIGISKILYRLVNASAIPHSIRRYIKPAFMIKDVNEPMRVDYLILACLMIRRDLIDTIGMLDENIFFYHEDCELGYRLKKYNLNIYYYPSAEIIHFGGSSCIRYKMETYREYFKSLIYVMPKYNSRINYYTIRMAIISGMLIRLLLSAFGIYRDIDRISIYKNDSDQNNNKLNLHEITKTYMRIIKDCIF